MGLEGDCGQRPGNKKGDTAPITAIDGRHPVLVGDMGVSHLYFRLLRRMGLLDTLSYSSWRIVVSAQAGQSVGDLDLDVYLGGALSTPKHASLEPSLYCHHSTKSNVLQHHRRPPPTSHLPPTWSSAARLVPDGSLVLVPMVAACQKT